MNRDLLLKLVFGGDATGATKAANDATSAVNRLGAAIARAPTTSGAEKALAGIPQAANQNTRAIGETSKQVTALQGNLKGMAAGLAASQSPFTLLTQQGLQFGKTLAGNTVLGAVKTLGRSLTLSITGAAFGVATLAAASFFGYLAQEQPSTEKILEDHEKLVKRIGEAYDGATGRLKNYMGHVAAFLASDAQEDVERLSGELGRILDRMGQQGTLGITNLPTATDRLDEFAAFQQPASGALQNFPALKVKVDDFLNSVSSGKPKLKEFAAELDKINLAAPQGSPLRKFTDEFQAALLPSLKLADELERAQDLFKGVTGNKPALNRGLGREDETAEAEDKRRQRMSERWAQIMREEAGALELLTDKQTSNTYEVSRAAKEQELLNKAHQVYGANLAPSVVKWIGEEADAYAKKAAAIAYAQNAKAMDMDLTKQQVAILDSLRGATSGITQEFFRAKEAGASWGEALMGVVERLTESFVGLLDKMLQAAAFGEQGTSGGGLLGSIAQSISGFFSPAPSLYASGAAFTNGIYSRPTMFSHGWGKLGVMAEKGPEAVMPLLFGRGGLSVGASTGRGETSLPLTRLSGGKLGVKAYADGDVFGGGMGMPHAANQNGGRGGLVINANTYNSSTGAKSETRVKENGRGGINIETFVTDIVDRHAARGGLDGTLGSRFQLNKKLNQYG